MPLAGSAQVGKIKGLVGPLSRKVSIEVAKEFSERVPFKRRDYSVYLGRELLGRYTRAERGLYLAFDAQGHPLGAFSAERAAYGAVSGSAAPRTV